jgi:arabinan endo-1,5-alpha-L-arabinosidase
VFFQFLIRFLPSFVLFLALATTSPACAQSTANPAINPLQGDLRVHDPVIAKSGSTYFAFATGFGVATKTSTDRITWRNGVSVFAAHPAWHKTLVPNAENSLWAPDISFRDGKYWLYYSVSSFGSNVSAIGLATATTLNPSGRAAWTDQGVAFRSVSSDNFNAIDPHVAVDTDGTPWLSFGSFWSGIKMLKLDAATGLPVANAQLISLANRTAGIEAPTLHKQGAYWYSSLGTGAAKASTALTISAWGVAPASPGPISTARASTCFGAGAI